MSRLEDLIAELCPDVVEYKKLEEIAEIGTGSSDRKDAIENGKYPLYVRSKDILHINSYEFDEEAIIIPGEGSIGEIFHYVNGKYALHQRAYRIHVTNKAVNTRFLYYYMFSHFKKFIEMKAVNATVTSIRKPMLQKFEVPVPPLAIQEEIVRILDAFTVLKAELKAELKARKEQFSAYSIKIISETKTNSFLKIRDLGKWSGGKTPSMNYPDFWNEGVIPWVSSKDMKSPYLTDTKDHVTSKAIDTAGLKLYPKNTIAMVVRSGILKHTLPIAFIPIETTVNQDIKILIPDSQINPKFAFYLLSAYSQEIRIKTKKIGGTVDSIDVRKLMNYELPVPPVEEQNRIVSILDRFDKLCNDISEGLPAEINAREKQYEYYRNQLLTFKLKGIEA